MEKELNRYRGSLKTQNMVFAVGAVVAAVFSVLGYLRLVETRVHTSPVGDGWTDMWSGFISGITFAVFIILIIGIIMNVRAMHNEEKLKKLYIKEHDERTMAINRYAGHMSYWFETVGLIMGIVIGGYFSSTIAIVCLGCLVYVCLVRTVLTLYYGKKL